MKCRSLHGTGAPMAACYPLDAHGLVSPLGGDEMCELPGLQAAGSKTYRLGISASPLVPGPGIGSVECIPAWTDPVWLDRRRRNSGRALHLVCSPLTTRAHNAICYRPRVTAGRFESTSGSLRRQYFSSSPRRKASASCGTQSQCHLTPGGYR